MIPCALYLRYSSDRQNERSPEDQEAVCRPFLDRIGYNVVAVYVDRAKSGSSIHDRADFQRLLRDAKTGLFKAVCAETTSRYGRDEEDRAAARKRLTFHGVAILTAADGGVVSRMVDGIKAVMDANQLEDLKLTVRRGMAAVIRDGRSAGGVSYGYRTVPKLPSEPRGDLEIVADQAAIVQRIFHEYAVEGRTPRAIASRLNAENVPGPRCQYWRPSTINGHAKRHAGILQNQLYCGRMIWNRCYKVRDPDSGQSVWRYRPENEWHRGDVPRLRIIDDDLFDAAQRRRAARKQQQGRAAAAPRRILSGLLRCGSCGAGMSTKDINRGRPRIVCTRMRETGSCTNRRTYYLDDIERIVVGGLRERLGSREAIAYFIERCNIERRNAAAGGADRRQVLTAKIEALDRQVQRAVAAIIAGRITDEEAAAHLPGLRHQRATVAAELETLSAAVHDAKPRPAAVDAYLLGLGQLEATINAKLAAGIDDSAKAIRDLIETVTIQAAPTGTPPGIVLKGALSSLLGLPSFRDSPAGGRKGGGGTPFPSDPPPAAVTFTLFLGHRRAA